MILPVVFEQLHRVPAEGDDEAKVVPFKLFFNDEISRLNITKVLSQFAFLLSHFCSIRNSTIYNRKIKDMIISPPREENEFLKQRMINGLIRFFWTSGRWGMSSLSATFCFGPRAFSRIIYSA